MSRWARLGPDELVGPAGGRAGDCPAGCHRRSLVPHASCAYLLGQYLGDGHIAPGGATYEYTRSLFSNRSADIRRLLVQACDRLGVATRPRGRYGVSVARRSSVAVLDEVVGPKA